MANYFSGKLKDADGIPQTTKPDADRHGYGMMSMKYVAEQYGGSMEIETVNDLFVLRVVLPRAKKRNDWTRGFWPRVYFWLLWIVTIFENVVDKSFVKNL